MFGGSFHSQFKGPCLFWEKEWGTINAERYCDRIVPIIEGYLRLLRQDGTPGHRGQYTTTELRGRDIYPISWPAFSPDLNPIEMAWNWMKDWIQEHYPDDRDLSYDRLREVVRAAWDIVPEAFFKNLIESMLARC